MFGAGTAKTSQQAANAAAEEEGRRSLAGEAVLHAWVEAVREHLEDVLPEQSAPGASDGELAAGLQLQVGCRGLLGLRTLAPLRQQHLL